MSRQQVSQLAISVILIMLFLAGCGAPAATPASETPTATTTLRPSMLTPAAPTFTPTPEPSAVTPELPDKILFIGNSLTYYNGGLNHHLEKLAASAHPPRVIEADRFTQGGASLERLWRKYHLGRATNDIDVNAYDVVVLQEDLPETDVRTFHEYARRFDAEIKKAGTRPLLFMAWSYERLGWITMEEIAHAHRDIATELGLDVAPVGLAWQRAMKDRPGLDMYASDREHPSIYGTYLATSVVYATVFGKSPVGLAYFPAGVSAEEAAFLQRIAWETVQEYRAAQ